MKFLGDVTIADRSKKPLQRQNDGASHPGFNCQCWLIKIKGIKCS